MSPQKPLWQALMLSLRRSSWALPPETLSTSLMTQITEHLSMVCKHDHKVSQNINGVFCPPMLRPCLSSPTFSSPHGTSRAQATLGFLKFLRGNLLFSLSGPLYLPPLLLDLHLP